MKFGHLEGALGVSHQLWDLRSSWLWTTYIGTFHWDDPPSYAHTHLPIRLSCPGLASAPIPSAVTPTMPWHRQWGNTSNCLRKVQDILRVDQEWVIFNKYTLQGTNISPKNGILKMIFLFPRWDMLISWSVFGTYLKKTTKVSVMILNDVLDIMFNNAVFGCVKPWPLHIANSEWTIPKQWCLSKSPFTTGLKRS